MAKEKRFIQTHKESGGIRIIVDKQTGVNYLTYASGYGGGITPLVDRDGKPLITSVSAFDEDL